MVATQYATTMSKPPKRNTENRSCDGCDARKETPCMFGHYMCSLHRPCIGQSLWEPHNCEVCRSLVGRLERMSDKDRAETLNSIEIMLKRCDSKIKEAFPTRTWKYEPLFFYTFRDFLPTPGGAVQRQETVVGQPQQPLTTPANSSLANVQDDEEIYDPEDPVEDLSPVDPTEELSNDNYLHQILPSEQLPFLNQALIPEQCTVDFCIPEAQGQSGQCSDPVHHPPQFQITPRSSLRDKFELGIPSKRSRSPSGTYQAPTRFLQDSPAYRGPSSSRCSPSVTSAKGTPHLAHSSYRSLNLGSDRTSFQGIPTDPRLARLQSTASTSRDHHDSQVIVQGTPVILPEQRSYTDLYTHKTWIIYDPLLHTRIGQTKMKMKSQDRKTLIIDEQTLMVNYKPGFLDLFVIAKEQTEDTPFLSNGDAHGYIRSGFSLHFSNNRSLNTRNFLDSSIEDHSHTYHLLLEIQKLDEKISRVAPYLCLADILKQFPDPQFEAFTFMNFTHGFALTKCEFARFAAKEPLNTNDFQAWLGSSGKKFEIPKVLADDELVFRQVMLHSFGSIHLQEKLADKVDSAPSEYKASINLESCHVLAIATRMRVDIKFHVAHWMMAKMRVRRWILQEIEHSNNFSMLSSSLWNKDIFPKESFTTLRSHNKNMLDLSNVLKITDRSVSKKPVHSGTKTTESIMFDHVTKHNSSSGYQNSSKKQKTSNNQNKPAQQNSKPQTGVRSFQQKGQNRNRNNSGNKKRQPPKHKQGKVDFQNRGKPKNTQ